MYPKNTGFGLRLLELTFHLMYYLDVFLLCMLLIFTVSQVKSLEVHVYVSTASVCYTCDYRGHPMACNC